MAAAGGELKKRGGGGAYVFAGGTSLLGGGVRAARAGGGSGAAVAGVGEEDQSRDCLMVLACNCSSVVADLQIAPGAVVDDGTLKVVVLQPNVVVGWVGVLIDVAARVRRGLASLRQWSGRDFQVSLDRPVLAEIDGDPVGLTRGGRFAVDPAALLVRVPVPAKRYPGLRSERGEAAVAIETVSPALPGPAVETPAAGERRRDARAARLKEGIYLTFTSLAVVLVLGTHSEGVAPLQALTTLLIAVTGTLLAVLLADLVAHLAVRAAMPSGEEFTHMLRVSVGALAALLVPIASLALAVLGFWSLESALTAATLALLVLLIVVGYFAIRRVPMPTRDRVVVLVAAAVLGGAVVLLELLAHGGRVTPVSNGPRRRASRWCPPASRSCPDDRTTE